MTKMQGLIGVRTTILYHDERSVLVGSLLAIVGIGINGAEQLQPCGIGNAQVQKTLDDIKLTDSLAIGYQILTQFLSSLFRTLTSHLDKGENHQRQVTLKLATRLLQLNHLLGHVLPIKYFYGKLCSCHYLLFNHHTLILNLGAKVRNKCERRNNSLFFLLVGLIDQIVSVGMQSETVGK